MSTKAAMTTAERNALPDSAFACVKGSGADKVRLYPIRDADGKLDPDHVRAALSRLGDPTNDQCGRDDVEAAAKTLGIGEAAKSADMAVKRVSPDVVEGLAIPFGGLFAGKDVDGEQFTKDTDLCLDWFGKSGRPVLYDHGLHRAMKSSVIGRQTDYELREEGLFARAELYRHARFRKAVDELIERGALGWSSGAMPHLVEPYPNAKRAGGVYRRWPWVELSLTPIPAAFDLSAVTYSVKSADLFDHFQSANDGAALPDEVVEAALKRLDEASLDPDEGTLDPESLADHIGRVSAMNGELRDRIRAYADMRTKAGRVLSAASIDRLMAHQETLHQVASDINEMCTTANGTTDAGKAALVAALLDVEVRRARELGVAVPS